MITVTGEVNSRGQMFVETFVEELLEYHEGYLMDLYCLNLSSFPIAFDGADLSSAPEDHTVHCMRDVQQCRENGFGLWQLGDDGNYSLAFSFDDAGNNYTLDFLDSTLVEKDVFVRVAGIPNANRTMLSNVSFSHVAEFCRRPSIVDIAVATTNLSTLVAAVTAAGLAEALSSQGPLTVFAPTNAAFEALPEGTLYKLLNENLPALTEILLYHVVDGGFPSSALADGFRVQTHQGQYLNISVTDVVKVNNATVVIPDVDADNGIVHVIDQVLLPAQITQRGFLIDMYCMTLDSYPIALDGANLVSAPEDHTVHCMRDVPRCRNNGFGILVEQPNGTYALTYAFHESVDEKIWEFLDMTKLIDTVEITVTGYPTNGLVTTLDSLETPELAAVTVRYHGETIKHTGYLIDILCWELEGHVAIDGANLVTNPQDHSIHCMRDIEACRARGHGILREKKTDCGYDLAYRFDEVGNQLALDYVDSSTKIDNVLVTVTGERDSSGMIFVETLEEELLEVHEGYLIDLYCLSLASFPIALDGAHLLNSPEDHKVYCMRDVPQCRQGGFGLWKKVDGAYDLAFSFDDAGNKFSLDFVDKTQLNDDVFIRVTGVPQGGLLSNVTFSHVKPMCRG